jgi:mono/diheme cytochrome c family protein
MTILRACALAALAWLAAIAAGCDWMPGRPQPADRPIAPTEVTDFSRLYGENCAGCHGADGTRGAALPLNNPVYLAIADDGSLRRVIAVGVAGTAMPPFAISAGGALTDEQIDLLISGMRDRWARPGAIDSSAPPYISASPGDPIQGAKIYAQYCGSCHGPDGKGGGNGADSIVDGAYLSLVSDQALRSLIIAGRPDLGHPDWRGYLPGKPLTAQDAADVVEWLATQRPKPPEAADAQSP